MNGGQTDAVCCDLQDLSSCGWGSSDQRKKTCSEIFLCEFGTFSWRTEERDESRSRKRASNCYSEVSSLSLLLGASGSALQGVSRCAGFEARFVEDIKRALNPPGFCPRLAVLCLRPEVRIVCLLLAAGQSRASVVETTR